jgi:hypothetical protein
MAQLFPVLKKRLWGEKKKKKKKGKREKNGEAKLRVEI